MTAITDPRDRLIVALDLPDAASARAMTRRIGDAAGFYKIGLELVYGGGLDLARELAGEGKRVFLDLKLHDIPNTVARAAERVAGLGATFLTVHAYPQTMRAAHSATSGSGLTLLAVTVMTSLDDDDLREAGFALDAATLVARRAEQARAIGLGGLILSPGEAAAMRLRLGPDIRLVTPGIRPEGAALADQKRAATPAGAIRAGADHIVVGRPVTRAPDPRAAAAAIVAEITAAL